MSSTTTKSHPCEQSHKFVNFSHLSWKVAATLAMIAAVISPAQAQTKGFSNVRINGVPLELPGNIMPIPTIFGSGPNGSIFEFTADFYNANGVTPVPPEGGFDKLLFSFQDFGTSTLAGTLGPQNFAAMVTSNATVSNPEVIRFFYTAPQDGTFNGAVNVDLFGVDIDYDLPNGDGIFDVAERSFGFNLVAASPVTSIPEATPTLGLIMLGAGGVASQLKKFKLARKQIS